MKRFMSMLIALAVLFAAMVPSAALSESSSTQYNLEVFSNEYISIVCTEIANDYIEFEATSRMENNPLRLNLYSISLDGTVVKIDPDINHSVVELLPGESRTLKLLSEFEHTEHSKLSMYFYLTVGTGGLTSYDVSEFDLGKTANPVSMGVRRDDGYSSSTLDIQYNTATDTSILLTVENKRSSSLTIFLEKPFFVNGVKYNESVSVLSIPPKSVDIFPIYMLDFDLDYSPNKVESLKCQGTVIWGGVGNEDFSIDVTVAPPTPVEQTPTPTPTPTATPEPPKPTPEVTATPDTTEDGGEAPEPFADMPVVIDILLAGSDDLSGNTESDGSGQFVRLERGSRGPEVEQLQTRLSELGLYTTAIDGDYGNGTARAIEKFQILNGLEVSGAADVALQEHLFSENAMGVFNDPRKYLFIAKGEPLFAFLTQTGICNYDVYNPKNVRPYVYAIANKKRRAGTDIPIRYFCEDQRVYAVDIIEPAIGYIYGSEYQECVIAMAKALCPAVSKDAVIEAYHLALNNPETGVMVICEEHIQFRYDNIDGSFTISH